MEFILKALFDQVLEARTGLEGRYGRIGLLLHARLGHNAIIVLARATAFPWLVGESEQLKAQILFVLGETGQIAFGKAWESDRIVVVGAVFGDYQVGWFKLRMVVEVSDHVLDHWADRVGCVAVEIHVHSGYVLWQNVRRHFGFGQIKL